MRKVEFSKCSINILHIVKFVFKFQPLKQNKRAKSHLMFLFFSSLYDKTTGCGIKKKPIEVFGRFLSNGLEFKCEISYTYRYVDNIAYSTYWY